MTLKLKKQRDLVKAKPYAKWVKKGRYVRRGEKAAGFIEGVAVFFKCQTEKYEGRNYYSVSDYKPSKGYHQSVDYDYDDPMLFDPWMFS